MYLVAFAEGTVKGRWGSLGGQCEVRESVPEEERFTLRPEE